MFRNFRHPDSPAGCEATRQATDRSAGVDRPSEEIVAEVVQLVRERIGPVAAFKSAVVVDRLPKTRSGKILRGTMRRIADGEEYTMPATIDDPAILSEIADAMERAGKVRSVAHRG